VPNDRCRYWLERSAGFRVDAHAGAIGIIEEVRVGEDGSPETLVVRVLDERMVMVPVQRVETVLPDEKRIVLAEAKAP
jgi:hypothetical protein